MLLLQLLQTAMCVGQVMRLIDCTKPILDLKKKKHKSNKVRVLRDFLVVGLADFFVAFCPKKPLIIHNGGSGLFSPVGLGSFRLKMNILSSVNKEKTWGR
jgi:hypothetical protein